MYMIILYEEIVFKKNIYINLSIDEAYSSSKINYIEFRAVRVDYLTLYKSTIV